LCGHSKECIYGFTQAASRNLKVNERIWTKWVSNISAISCREQVNFQWNGDEVHFVLDQHA